MFWLHINIVNGIVNGIINGIIDAIINSIVRNTKLSLDADSVQAVTSDLWTHTDRSS